MDNNHNADNADDDLAAGLQRLNIGTPLHLKKRKHYRPDQGRMLQQNIDDFTEGMQDKYSVDLHDVPLTDFINVISNLNQHEQQDVRRLLLSRAKLKHFGH